MILRMETDGRAIGRDEGYIGIKGYKASRAKGTPMSKTYYVSTLPRNWFVRLNLEATPSSVDGSLSSV